MFFDGDLHTYFKDIAVFTNTRFDEVFQNCEDYPTGGARDFEGFWNWIRRYQVQVDLFWPRYPDLSAPRILQLAAFKRRFDAFVARVRPADGASVKGLDALSTNSCARTSNTRRTFPVQAASTNGRSDDEEGRMPVAQVLRRAAAAPRRPAARGLRSGPLRTRGQIREQ